MIRTHKLLLLLAVAAPALVLSACSSDGDGGGAASPTSTEGVADTPVAQEFRTVTSDDGRLTVEIPAGAVDGEAEITIATVPLDELPEELRLLQGAGTGYRLEPDGLEFSEPVAVSLELDRGKLDDSPEDGITAYGLVSFNQGGERELLDELVTEASLVKDKVLVRGELSHSSWLGRTKASLTVTLEKVQPEQAVSGTFTARATAQNTGQSGTVTLGPTLVTFIAAGTASVQGNPFFYRQATFGPSEEIGKSGTFDCSESPSPGIGSYGVRVITTSRVAAEGAEVRATKITVVLNGEVECG
jgi:hypothetical protein